MARHPQDVLLLREDPHHSPPGGEAHPELEVRVLGVFGRAKQPGHDPRGQSLQADHDGARTRTWDPAPANLAAGHRPGIADSVEVWADGGTLVAFVKDTSHLRSSMSLAP